MSQSQAPKYDELIWPTIKALKELGGSGSNREIVDKIIELEGYSEEIQNIPHRDGRETKIEYNAAWSRTYLKNYGAIERIGTALWLLLEEGECLNEHDIPELVKHVRLENKRIKKKTEKQKSTIDSPEKIKLNIETLSWKEQLLELLYALDPYDFERLCQLILRKSGFTKVEVTSKSGDGGIDGTGILRVNLLSFHVSFQCKRYKDTVGAPSIRDFRGAMIGRGDKGLFITTGTFTTDARKEANRDGAPAIDLIDGEELCDLLKELKLGVKTELVEEVVIQQDWFDNL